MTYRYYMAELPWTPTRDEEQRFRKILLWVLLIFFISCILMPLLPVREKPKEEFVEVPPRLARIIEERKKPPPPKKIEKIESNAKPKPEQKKPPKPKQAKPKQKPHDKQVARKKARSSGLLAFSNELAALRERPSLGKLNSKALKKGSSTTREMTRSMITSSVGKGSGGINTSNLTRDTGGLGLDGRATTRVLAPNTTKGVNGGVRVKGKRKTRATARNLEQIQITFDRNKGAIYTIYNRELRKDPTLQGKVVLKITIAPSGAVTACTIVSSELDNPKLERKLVQRVKLINFGAADVAPFTFSYPIDFFPA